MKKKKKKYCDNTYKRLKGKQFIKNGWNYGSIQENFKQNVKNRKRQHLIINCIRKEIMSQKIYILFIYTRTFFSNCLFNLPHYPGEGGARR